LEHTGLDWENKNSCSLLNFVANGYISPLESHLLLSFMKKCLFLASLVLFILPSGLRAQNTFEFSTDTACVGQKIRVKPSTMNANSYYWGFCSGYLNNTPLGDYMGTTYQFNSPEAIEIAKDGNNYYGFVVNGTGSGELLRLDYGTSLHNVPTVTNFGNIDATVSPSPNSIYLTQDSGKWFLFVCGGSATPGTPSTLSRFDFGGSLKNVPNGVRMGNIGNRLDNPQGIFVAREGDVYYGFVVNQGNDRLIRLNFGKNISNTPSATDFGNIGLMANPNDIAPIYDQGKWYFLIPNLQPFGPGTYTLTKLSFGNTLSNTPVGTNPQGISSGLTVPTAITVIKDCGSYKAFVTNRNVGGNPSFVTRINIPNLATNNWSDVPANAVNVVEPEDISRIIRDRDTLYAFIVNRFDNSLARLTFPQCQRASIQSSTAAEPPAFSYDTAGTYNVFLALNEGLPNMSMECRQVYVRNIPPITISRDTLICQGDTVPIFINSQFATGYFWSPNYNIGDTQGSLVFAYPDITTTYSVRVPFFDGCEVDTVIKVDVSRVQADAGPDREIADGAHTVIGGPNTFTGPKYLFEWFPTTWLDNPFNMYATVTPQTTRTYYLKVTNTDGCVDIDTVVVRVACGGFNLPNAFSPDNTRESPKSFGMLNRQIGQLNYFRIFDRWGKMVFSTTDKTKEWDGTYNGEKAPFGVYVWEADGFCEVTEERIRASGNVTLIR
jgi:gliding motility-associated-like protein